MHDHVVLSLRFVFFLLAAGRGVGRLVVAASGRRIGGTTAVRDESLEALEKDIEATRELRVRKSEVLELVRSAKALGGRASLARALCLDHRPA